MTKFCKDCKHSDAKDGEQFMRCRAPQALGRPDPVTGSTESRWTYCSIHRAHGGPFQWLYIRIEKQCGRAGRWFASKEKA